MDGEKWEEISSKDLKDMPDGSEIIWERKYDIWEDVTVNVLVKGKLKEKKEKRLKGFRYEAFRTILSKYHHKTVSGYLPCLVSAPNGEFPYMTPWQGDWIYAGNSSINQMWRRKNHVEEWSSKASGGTHRESGQDIMPQMV